MGVRRSGSGFWSEMAGDGDGSRLGLIVNNNEASITYDMIRNDFGSLRHKYHFITLH